jgi:hypothetical protein
MSNSVTIAARRIAYLTKVQAALPCLEVAQSICCTSGAHFAAFLNSVGIPASNGGTWSTRTANRLVKYALDHGLLHYTIDFNRHRGRRNPYLESRRTHGFAKAVESCRAAYEASICPNCSEVQEEEADTTTVTIITSQKQSVAVLA